MRGTKPSSTSCPAFCGSVTPSYRRTATYIALAYLLHIEGGVSKARQLANEPSVEGCKRRRNFLELRLAELRRTTLPRSRVNKGDKEEGRSVLAPALPLGIRLWLLYRRPN